jgi:hypothetical protein
VQFHHEMPWIVSPRSTLHAMLSYKAVSYLVPMTKLSVYGTVLPVTASPSLPDIRTTSCPLNSIQKMI